MQSTPQHAPRAGNPIVSFLVAGWLLGGIEGALVPTTKPRVLVVAFAAVLASVPSLLAGIAVMAGLRVLRRVPVPAALASRLRRFSPGEAGDRSGVIRACALVLAAFLVVVALVFAAQLLFLVLFALQEQVLAVQLAVAATGAMIAIALLLTPLLASLLTAPLAALDRRLRLSLRRQGALFFGLLVALPLFLSLYPFARRYGALLGRGREGMILALLTCAGAQAMLLGRHIPAAIGRRASPVLAALGGVLIAGAAVLYTGQSEAALSAERGMTASFGARVARFMTDVDHDGASTLFGGYDCAPFDPARAPALAEIHDNGVDEDCNGVDDHLVPPPPHHPQELFSGALQTGGVRRYNIVWVIIEAFRADHVGALGYDRPTTPYLDALARESLLFTNAHSQSSATILSVPSMLSGVNPGEVTWQKTRGVLPQIAGSEEMIAERLKQRGYATGMVLDTYLRHGFHGIHQGFDRLLLAEPDSERVNNRPRRNPLSTAQAADFLARTPPGRPFFLVVYYPDTHSPYTRHRDVDDSHFSRDEIGDYDTELAFLDEQLRSLVEQLRARPSLWNDTIVVVTADHGEEFGEHGGIRHALTCHREVVHVPLLVRVPGLSPARVGARVGLVDIVPSLLELTGDRDHLDRLSGQSLLVPALRPDRLDPQRPVFCSIASVSDKYGTFFRRAVRQGDLALFQDVNEGRFSLFDTAADPGEQQDLSVLAEHAARATALRRLLEQSQTGNLRDHTRM